VNAAAELLVMLMSGARARKISGVGLKAGQPLEKQLKAELPAPQTQK
jgi:hypothetical protein